MATLAGRKGTRRLMPVGGRTSDSLSTDSKDGNLVYTQVPWPSSDPDDPYSGGGNLLGSIDNPLDPSSGDYSRDDPYSLDRSEVRVWVEPDPGKPGTPTTLEEVDVPGWNHYAWSINPVYGASYFTFVANADPKLIVGLSHQSPYKVDVAIADIEFGVLLRPSETMGNQTSLFIVEAGKILPDTEVHIDPRNRLTAILAFGVFKVLEDGDEVAQIPVTSLEQAIEDGVEGEDLDEYTYSEGALLRALAFLYTADDYVDDLHINTLGQTMDSIVLGANLSLSTSPTNVVGYVGTLWGRVSFTPRIGYLGLSGSVSPRVSVVGSSVGTVGLSGVLPDPGVSGTLELPALECFASESSFAAVDGAIPSLELTIQSGLPQIPVSGIQSAVPRLSVAIQGYSGGVGAVDSAVPAVQMLASDRAYAAISGETPGIIGYGYDSWWADDLLGLLPENLTLWDGAVAQPNLFVDFWSGVELSDNVTVSLVLDESVFDGVLISDQYSLSELIYAVINSGLMLRTSARPPINIPSQYAFDADTGAASRYTNFEFSGFASTPDGYYAFKPDGVYVFRSGDDNGESISAALDIGTQDFGTNRKKHVDNVFIAAATDGTMYLKMGADGRDRTYRVIQRDPLSKVRTGRGVTARQWNVRLEIVDATEVELEGLEFVLATSRRWVR